MNIEENKVIELGELKDIDISKLVPSPLNTYDTNNIEDLRGNIESCGLITPLSIIGPFSDETYQILSGEKRFKALTQLVADGHEEYRKVPCYVIGKNDMPELDRVLIIESANLETRDYKDTELDQHRMNIMRTLKAMAELKDEKHSSIIKKAEQYMGCSPRYRKMYLRLVEENDENVLDLINKNKVTIVQANEILGLSDEEKQSVIEDLQQEGAKASEVISKVKDAKKARDTKDSGEPVSRVSSSVSLEDMSDEEIDSEWDSLTSSLPSQSAGSTADQYDGYSAYKDNSLDDKDKATMVMKWCERMLKKKELKDFSETEEEAIDVCRRLIEHFDSLE